MAGDGLMGYNGGTAGNDDLRATKDVDGTVFNARAGDDTLRGGRADDILNGGAGNDKLWGGDGADQFRFFADQFNHGDKDAIYDLDFSEGDTLVFGAFAAGTFADTAGLNAFTNDTACQVSSWEGLVAFVAQIGGTASEVGNTDKLRISYQVDGATQTIDITGGWDAFVAASTPVAA